MEAFKRKLALDHTAPAVVELKAAKAGYISRCDARIIGEVVRDLGGGRITKDSVINYDVGVDQLAKPGDTIKDGTVLARIHAATKSQAEIASGKLMPAFEISASKPRLKLLLADSVKSSK